MRVVVLGGFAPSLVRFRGPLLSELVRRGHEVVALSAGGTPALEAALGELGVDYREIPLGRTGLDPRADLETLGALARALRAIRPDVFFAYTLKAVIWGGLAARLCRVPRRIGMLTGLGYALSPPEDRRRAVVRAVAGGLLRAAASGYDGLVFQNPDDARELAAAGFLPAGVPRHLVDGSGIDLAEFPAVPVPAGDPVFLLIARLLRDKGLGEFVAAARDVRRRLPRARFVVVGSGDANPAAIPAAELEAWRREGVVELAGEQADVRPFLAACTTYVLPSYREGTPRSVLEALATGRAVITTDVPGCRETVRDGDNGLLVPARQSGPLAEAMVALGADPARAAAMGARGRALAEARYNVHAVNDAMLRVMGL
jgi:glycosyltransferase involved in cell wall biosynthesis